MILTSTAVYWTNQLEVWSPLSEKKRAYDCAIAQSKKLINQYKPDALKFEVSNQKIVTFKNRKVNQKPIFSVSFFPFKLNVSAAECCEPRPMCKNKSLL